MWTSMKVKSEIPEVTVIGDLPHFYGTPVETSLDSYNEDQRKIPLCLCQGEE